MLSIRKILKKWVALEELLKTGSLFLIGTMAISGVPLFQVFFSKDEILISAWNAGHPFLFLLALITAFLTAFYMFRLSLYGLYGRIQRVEKGRKLRNLHRL